MILSVFSTFSLWNLERLLMNEMQVSALSPDSLFPNIFSMKTSTSSSKLILVCSFGVRFGMSTLVNMVVKFSEKNWRKFGFSQKHLKYFIAFTRILSYFSSWLDSVQMPHISCANG